MRPATFHKSCWTHTYVHRIGCDEYERIYARAGYACEMCGATDYLGLDHDHILGSGAIRGVLCPKHNAGHMRLVDAGERPVDLEVRRFLLNAWHLERDGHPLGYEPMVNPEPADLTPHDHNEVNRLVRTSMHWRPRIAKAELRFEHPGIAACVAHYDFRPVYRVIYLTGRGTHLAVTKSGASR